MISGTVHRFSAQESLQLGLRTGIEERHDGLKGWCIKSEVNSHIATMYAGVSNAQLRYSSSLLSDAVITWLRPERLFCNVFKPMIKVSKTESTSGNVGKACDETIC